MSTNVNFMSKHKSRITNTKRQIIIHIPKLKEI